MEDQQKNCKKQTGGIKISVNIKPHISNPKISLFLVIKWQNSFPKPLIFFLSEPANFILCWHNHIKALWVLFSDCTGRVIWTITYHYFSFKPVSFSSLLPTSCKKRKMWSLSGNKNTYTKMSWKEHLKKGERKVKKERDKRLINLLTLSAKGILLFCH